MDIKIIASGSTGNATKISDGASSLLLDAGINIKRLQSETGFTLSSLAGCFITHEHGDHSKAVKDLAKLGINVYSSRGTFDKLKLSGHRFREMNSMETVTVGSFNVMAFDVVHDCAEPLGFLIESKVTGEKLLYFSDTAYIKYTFTGLTHIIAECNHGDHELRESVRNEIIDRTLAKRIVQNHMSLERFVKFLNANDMSKVKQVYLIHLSDNNSNAERFKKMVQQITGTEVYVF
jgi:phosphoribosyl 1,2-cyclic phosphodiesterase